MDDSARYTGTEVEDYTSKHEGERVEIALFGGDLVPLQSIASVRRSTRCDAPAEP